MRASLSIKPTTDAYSSVGVAALLPIEFPLIRVVNPTVDLTPNAAALSPNDPRVLQWPNYGFFAFNNTLTSILGGTSLSARWWYYEPALSVWYSAGNGFAPLVCVIGAGQGQPAIAMHASKPHYLQVTAVVGAVTDLFYGYV